MSATQKSIRIKTDTINPQDQYITVPFDRSIGLIELLSIKLPTKELFRTYNSDTGIIAGRVFANGNSANNSIGVENVKVSIFIPKDQNLNTDGLSDYNKTKIKTAELQYPFEDSTTKYNGKRFSLLPKWSRNRGLSGFIFNVLGIGNSPKQPVGNRLELEEILSNEELSYLEKKYYKYSTTTNKSGDYMIYLPVGDYEIICETDLTDIGPYSVNGHQMTQVMGYPEEYFENGKLKNGVDIDVAPNIIRLTSTVSVKPLWSQNIELTNNPETVGITRQDFRLPIELKANFTIFGSNITMGKDVYYGDRTLFRIFLGLKCLCFKPILNLNCNGSIKFNSTKCEWDFGIDGAFCKTRLSFNIPLPDPIGDVFIDTGIDVPTGFWIGFRFKTPAFIPFLFLRLFSIKFCGLNGGKYSIPPTSLIWLSDIGCFSVNDIVDLSGDKITLADALDRNIGTLNLTEDISNMQGFNTKINVFQVKTDSSLVDLDLENDVTLLSDSEYVKFNNDKGDFVLQITPNRKKMISSEDGTLIESSNDNGIYTEWDGYITMTHEDNIIGSDGDKVKIIKPNIRIPNISNNFNETFNFKFNEIYSFNTLMGVNDTSNECVGGLISHGIFSESIPLITGLFADCDQGDLDNNIMYNTPGKIIISEPNSSIYPIPNNYFNVQAGGDNESIPNFSFDYLKYILYFPNVLARKPYISGKRTKMRSCSRIISWDKLNPNNEIIGNHVKNTQFYINPDYFKINFINVDKNIFINHIINNDNGIKEGTQYYYKGFLGNNSLKNIINKNLI